jgi:N-acetylmuramoyl-L-alanine amidase
MKKKYFIIFIFLYFLISNLQAITLKIRYHDHPDFTRVVIESYTPFSYHVHTGPGEISIIIEESFSFHVPERKIQSRILKEFQWERKDSKTFFKIILKKDRFTLDYFTLINPFRLVLDIKELSPSIVLQLQAREFKNVLSSFPDKNIASIKTIVIDPGHGGSDRGARGPSGLLEKEVTLTIAKELKSIIERNLPFRVILTRTEDVNLSLEERASIANNQKADMFISIHANASYRKLARGSETYFLSLHASDEETRRLAYFENNSDQLEEEILPENIDDIKLILWDLAQTSYLKQSSQLAESIQHELNYLLGTANRGIKQAPFKVLSNVAMPAVLIEVAFISNPKEEKKLSSQEFQYQVALAIYRGIVNYLRQYGES